MGGDERIVPPSPDPLEERLRRRLRVIVGITFLGLVTVLSLADTFGPSDLHVSEFIFSWLASGVLLIVGVEGAAKLIGRK